MQHVYIMQSRTMDEDVVQVLVLRKLRQLYGDKRTRKSLKCQLLKVRCWGEGCKWIIFLTKGERRLHVETPTLTALLAKDVFETIDVFLAVAEVGGGRR